MMSRGDLRISTSHPQEMIDITTQVQHAVAGTGISEAVCMLFNPHTTAGLTINEGADPDVRKDLLGALKVMVPHAYPYAHAEGYAPAHLMATLTGNTVTVFVEQGRLRLGTWQHIFFCEYDGPRERTIWWKLIAG